MSNNNTSAVRNILIFTLVLNVFVALLKIIYGSWANAMVIRADGFHSFADGLNNVVALTGIIAASRPPDDDHPYGHRKYEVFASLFIGASLMYIAIEVVGDAWSRFWGEGDLPHLDNRAYIVLGITFAINLAVATYQSHMGKKLKSIVLTSDAHHTRSDLFVTAGVVIAVIVTQMGYPQVDLIAALGIAAFIAWTAVGVLKENLGYLADGHMVDVAKVRTLATAIEGVHDAYEIRSRGIPGDIFVDLTVSVDGELSVEAAHHIAHDAIDAIKDNIEGCIDVTVHTEPATDGAKVTSVTPD